MAAVVEVGNEPSASGPDAGVTYKTTSKDVDYFERRVNHWLKFFGLQDWNVSTYLGDMKEADNQAECEMWHNAHGAHIRLREDFKYRHEREWLDRLAMHEVSHILLCDLKRLIHERCVTDNMAETAEHAVIRRLENALTR